MSNSGRRPISQRNIVAGSSNALAFKRPSKEDKALGGEEEKLAFREWIEKNIFSESDMANTNPKTKRIVQHSWPGKELTLDILPDILIYMNNYIANKTPEKNKKLNALYARQASWYYRGQTIYMTVVEYIPSYSINKKG